MANLNSKRVTFEFFDAYGDAISDRIRFTFDNLTLNSVDFQTTVPAAPYRFDLVANPNGVWRVIIEPDSYEAKTLAVSVSMSSDEPVRSTFLLKPQFARPVFPTSDEIFGTDPYWARLAGALRSAFPADPEREARALWDRLTGERPFAAAGLLNVYARAMAAPLANGSRVADYFDALVSILPDRILVHVKPELYPAVVASLAARDANGQRLFHSVPGSLHSFPDGYRPYTEVYSFKTLDREGNLQLTFAHNAVTGAFIVDADIDDNQGFKHVIDVLDHKIRRRETHAFDINQILALFKLGDPRYRLEIISDPSEALPEPNKNDLVAVGIPSEPPGTDRVG
jgi:hypothetical protein